MKSEKLMKKSGKFSGPVVDCRGVPFHPGDLIFSANYGYSPYVVEGVDQDQHAIFISRRDGKVAGRIFRSFRPRWFQIFKSAKQLILVCFYVETF